MLRRVLNAIADLLHLDVTPDDVRRAREADDARRMAGWKPWQEANGEYQRRELGKRAR